MAVLDALDVEIRHRACLVEHEVLAKGGYATVRQPKCTCNTSYLTCLFVDTEQGSLPLAFALVA